MDPFEYPRINYQKKLLNTDNIIFVVAKYEEKIIGGSTAYELPSSYFEANEVYVYDLAVHHDFQRRGVGTRLMD